MRGKPKTAEEERQKEPRIATLRPSLLLVDRDGANSNALKAVYGRGGAAHFTLHSDQPTEVEESSEASSIV